MFCLLLFYRFQGRRRTNLYVQYILSRIGWELNWIFSYGFMIPHLVFFVFLFLSLIFKRFFQLIFCSIKFHFNVSTVPPLT